MLLTSKTCSPLMRLRHFRNPVLLSCECKGTTTFPIHQMFGKVFRTNVGLPSQKEPILTWGSEGSELSERIRTIGAVGGNDRRSDVS